MRRNAESPVRTCVGCRQKKPAPDMIRLTVGADGDLVVGGPSSGRGAWACDDSCRAVAADSGRLDRALKRGGTDRKG